MTETDESTQDSITAALASLRAARAQANAAADAWSNGESLVAPIDAALAAIARARMQLEMIRRVLPGHARRVRLLARAIETMEAVLPTVHALPAPLPEAVVNASTVDEEEARLEEETALLRFERAMGVARRAAEAAAPAAVSRGLDENASSG